MKIRVWKLSNGGVVYNHLPEAHGYEPENYPLPKASWMKDVEGFFIADDTDLFSSEIKDGTYHEMLHFDGDCKLENLKQDKSWENVLMPSFLIVKKHIYHLDKSLDAELAKDEPDPIVAMKLSQKKEAAKKLDPVKNEKELLEIALEGLGRAEIAKPLIEEKLNKKLAALTSDETIK